MKWIVPGLALFLAGCVTAQEAGRSVAQSPGGATRMSVLERSKAYAIPLGLDPVPERVAEIAQRVFDANRDLCSGWTCDVPLVYFGSTYSDATRVRIGIGGSAAKATDGSLAQTVGHEWSHVLLSDVFRTRAGTSDEDEADCVGSVFAARSGFDVEDAAKRYLALANEPSTLAKYPKFGVYSPLEVKAENVRAAGRKTRSLMDAGKPIDRAAIKEICGVAP